MQIIGIIPARWGSTRFPGKPLASILGKSLIQRTYENASRSKLLDDLIIATDNEQIRNHVEEFGGKVVMSSPFCLTGTDRVAQVAASFCPQATLIVNIQGDEPCLNPLIIDTLVDSLLKNPEAVLSTPVAKIDCEKKLLSPSIVKCVFDKEGKALYFSRSPIPHKGQAYRHIGIYCFRRDFLLKYVTLPPSTLQVGEDLEQLKVLENGFVIQTCLVEDKGIGVDLPEDIQRVEQILWEE